MIPLLCRGWLRLSTICRQRPGRAAEPAPRFYTLLHAMNIRTWGRDRLVRDSFDLDEVAGIQSGLDRIASGEQMAHPVSNALRQLVAVVE
jgi:hypothetical protein